MTKLRISTPELEEKYNRGCQCATLRGQFKGTVSARIWHFAADHSESDISYNALTTVDLDHQYVITYITLAVVCTAFHKCQVARHLDCKTKYHLPRFLYSLTCKSHRIVGLYKERHYCVKHANY